MREVASPRSEIPPRRSGVTPLREEELYLDGNFGDPKYCYRLCRADVRRLVLILQKEMLTKDAAIQWVSKKYGLKSFVRKMWNGEYAKVEFWQWHLIRVALRNAEKLDQLRTEHQTRVEQAFLEFRA